MARVEPNTGTVVQLEDLEPYTVTLVSPPELGDPHPEYGQSLKFVFQVGNNPDDTLWDFVPFRYPDGTGKLGIRKDGTPSRLRALLNAFGGKPERGGIAYVDDETWEVGYDDGTTTTIAPGLRVKIRGQSAPRADGQGDQFRVKHYRPAAQSAQEALGLGRPEDNDKPVPAAAAATAEPVAAAAPPW